MVWLDGEVTITGALVSTTSSSTRSQVTVPVEVSVKTSVVLVVVAVKANGYEVHTPDAGVNRLLDSSVPSEANVAAVTLTAPALPDFPAARESA